MARTADRFYVYEHMRNDAGVVFYVGKGNLSALHENWW